MLTYYCKGFILKSTLIFPILNFAHLYLLSKMQTQARNATEDRTFGKNYREFSRRRYTELKNGTGKPMREPEIIQKIIKQWDEIQLANKNRKASRTNVETPMKMEENMVALDLKNKQKLKSTSAKKEQELNQERSSFEHELDIHIRPFDQSDPAPKTKSIKKERKQADYIEFYKTHFESIMKAHPYWSNNEVTIIIKLMWKKHKALQGTKRHLTKIRPIRPKSGRMAFKMSKRSQGMESIQISNKWKQLPSQSKKMWASIGDPSISVASKGNDEMIMKASRNEGGSSSLKDILRRRI